MIHSFLSRVAIIALLASHTPAATVPFPWQPTIPLNLGTQSSNADERDLHAISHDLGAHWLRIECGWMGVEHAKGIYDFTGIDKQVATLFEQDLEPVIIFDYGNPLYQDIDRKNDPFCGPTTPEAQQGYANFCAAVAGHLTQRFTGRVFVYELWNEPNFEWFWHPKPDASAYVRLCSLASPAIRKAASNCILIGPATSSAKGKFIADCIDGGILDSVDAFSVHPYRHTAPETAIEDYAALRKLMAAKNIKDGKPSRIVPLISSEWGYSATPDKSIGISCEPKLQGAYLTRTWLINAWQEIGLSIWFQWRSGSDDAPDPWSKFGMIRDDRTPRPAISPPRRSSTHCAAAAAPAGSTSSAMMITCFHFRTRRLAQRAGRLDHW